MNSLFKVIISIFICQFAGIIGSLFTISSIPIWYATLNKPFFAPPNWIFGPVWIILYFLMGVSFFLIWNQGWKKKPAITARTYFFIQLGINAIWSPIIFGLQSPLLALIIIIALWIMIILTMKNFYLLSKWSTYLLIPYVCWVSFATALNAAIVILN